MKKIEEFVSKLQERIFVEYFDEIMVFIDDNYDELCTEMSVPIAMDNKTSLAELNIKFDMFKHYRNHGIDIDKMFEIKIGHVSNKMYSYTHWNPNSDDINENIIYKNKVIEGKESVSISFPNIFDDDDTFSEEE